MFCISQFSKYFTDMELAKKLKKLNKFSLTQFSNNKSKTLRNDKELQLLTEILYRSSHSQIQSQNLYELIFYTIKILLKYTDSLLEHGIKLSKNKHERRYQQAKNNFIKLLKIFVTKKQGETIHIVIDIIDKENFWHFERGCVDIIQCLFECGYNGVLVYHEICNEIEFHKNPEVVDIKCTVQVLYELLSNYNWPETEETVDFIKRLLNIYYKSLYDTEKLNESLFFNIRSSLELCVRYIIQNISNSHLLIIIHLMGSWSINENVNNNFILNYSSTLEYAAYMHKEDMLHRILTSDILSLLMQMIRSSIQFVSILGNRVFQRLIDRGKHIMLFNTPKIFFEDVKLNIKINKYYKEDRRFLMKYREFLHESLIKSFINHRYTRLNLETTYCTTCLIAIEVPCGFLAAALSCLMMNLQEIIKKQPDQFGKEASYHIHAIIISVLSFVCWIHHAKDFHVYVNKIVIERAQWAPHLNPPLKSRYNFAEHHVLWNKPELYFVDWEVRYGLWRRFRLNDSPKSRSKTIYYEDDD